MRADFLAAAQLRLDLAATAGFSVVDVKWSTQHVAGASGVTHFAELKRRTADWSAEQFRQVGQDGADVERRLLALLHIRQ